MTNVVPAAHFETRYRVTKSMHYILASISHAFTKPFLESLP
jgi:hypothetical protein